MTDSVRMSKRTMGILLAQEKILAEPVDTGKRPGENRNEWTDRLMNRKLLYMGQEIIIDDNIPDRQVLAAEAAKTGPDRFKLLSPSAKVTDTTTGQDTDTRELKREIIF